MSHLAVDMIACDGRGLCAEVLPELVSLDEWGFPILAGGEVPRDLRALAGEAIRLCPRLALRMESGAARIGSARAGRRWPARADPP